MLRKDVDHWINQWRRRRIREIGSIFQRRQIQGRSEFLISCVLGWIWSRVLNGQVICILLIADLTGSWRRQWGQVSWYRRRECGEGCKRGWWGIWDDEKSVIFCFQTWLDRSARIGTARSYRYSHYPYMAMYLPRRRQHSFEKGMENS